MKPKVVVVREKEETTKTVYVDRPVYVSRPVSKSQDDDWWYGVLGMAVVLFLLAAVLVLMCVVEPKLTVWIVCGVGLLLACAVISWLEKQ